MKALRHTSILISAMLTMAATLNSCDAVWGADVSYNTPYYGWDSEWLPTLAGTPVVSPYYYGGISFPIGNPGPVFRPGDGPLGNPVNIRPNRPVRPVVPPANGATGTLRPGQSSGNGPSVISPAPGASTFPNIKGSNPGIQLPPAGTGYRVVQQGK